MGFFSNLDVHLQECHDYRMERVLPSGSPDAIEFHIYDEDVLVGLFYNPYDAYLFIESRKETDAKA